MSIIHLMPDSIYTEQYINFVKMNYQNQQHYFYIPLGLKKNAMYVIQKPNVFFIPECSVGSILFRRNEIFNIDNVSAVFIHYFDIVKALIVRKYYWNKKIDVYWCIWGGDIYTLLPPDCLYDIEQRQFLPVSERKTVSFIKHRIRRILEKLIMKRCDYVSDLAFRGDFRRLLNKQAKPFQAMYPICSSLEVASNVQTPTVIDMIQKHKYKILIGNSGSVTNNHISAFKRISRYVDEDIAVIVPLSYGDPTYISEILTLGKNVFNDKFIPLTIFYSPEEYDEILKSIDVAIWNHKVSEGVGNIRKLLNFGKKIYFRKTPYSDWERLDALNIVYEDIETINSELTIEDLCKPYSDDVIYNNKRSIEKFGSLEVVKDIWDRVLNKY